VRAFKDVNVLVCMIDFFGAHPNSHSLCTHNKTGSTRLPLHIYTYAIQILQPQAIMSSPSHSSVVRSDGERSDVVAVTGGEGRSGAVAMKCGGRVLFAERDVSR
jgi:hypothetical protein